MAWNLVNYRPRKIKQIKIKTNRNKGWKSIQRIRCHCFHNDANLFSQRGIKFKKQTDKKGTQKNTKTKQKKYE